MNKKLKLTKSVIQAMDEQAADILEDFEKDIENFKIATQNKDNQLVYLGKILKVAKSEYEKVTKENKELKDYIIKKQKIQQQQQQQKKQFPRKNIQKRYKKIVYESASETEPKAKQEETSDIEIEEVVEE